MFITTILLFTCMVTPYRIAFVEYDDNYWLAIDSLIDAGFGIDIVLNFFMAYYDESEDIVDNRKKIALGYMKSWFFIDVAAIIPISQFMET